MTKSNLDLDILAIDPGGTTGMARCFLSAEGEVSDWASWDIGPGEHHAELYRQLYEVVIPDVVICERFDYRPKLDKAELISREYIGIIKLARPDVVLQSASEAKGFVNDNKLRALDLWAVGSPHQRDAYRHLLYYLVVRERVEKGILDKWLRK